jgi:acyl carrier protein
MMAEKEKIQQLVLEVIDENNAQVPEDEQLEKSIDSVLYGESGKLNSLGLVNFIVAIEQKISEQLDTTITLADEKAMSQRNSPFRSVGTLVDYIRQLLKENA